MVKGLNITHGVVNTHYNTAFFFFLRKLIDIADRISPAINIYENMAIIFLFHEIVVSFKILN